MERATRRRVLLWYHPRLARVIEQPARIHHGPHIAQRLELIDLARALDRHQRCVVAILADDRVDDDAVARQALLDDPWRQWCRYYSELFARPASPFLSFGDQHEVLRGFYIQLRTLLVADQHRFFAAAFAHALIRCTGQNPLYARKIRRQLLPARMFGRSLRRAPGGRFRTPRLLDLFTDDGFKLE